MVEEIRGLMFLKGISPKENVIAQLEFEFAYDVAAQHLSLLDGDPS